MGVVFTPTVDGLVTGVLTVTDNNGGLKGSKQTVSLTGLGTGVTFTPNPLNFGNQAILTTSAAGQVTLTNTNSSTVGIVSILASGVFAQTNRVRLFWNDGQLSIKSDS